MTRVNRIFKKYNNIDQIKLFKNSEKIVNYLMQTNLLKNTLYRSTCDMVVNTIK